MHECKPQTETIVISQLNSVKVNHAKRRTSKRRKVRRIELSPPPVRRTTRSRRTRLPSTEEEQEGSYSTVYTSSKDMDTQPDVNSKSSHGDYLLSQAIDRTGSKEDNCDMFELSEKTISQATDTE